MDKLAALHITRKGPWASWHQGSTHCKPRGRTRQGKYGSEEGIYSPPPQPPFKEAHEKL